MYCLVLLASRYVVTCFVCYCYGDDRYLHGLTHSFPTRRSSDLLSVIVSRASCTVTTPARRLLSTLLAPPGGSAPSPPPAAPSSPSSSSSCARSEEHTSELQSLMRISYAVFCLKTKSASRQSIHTHETTSSNKPPSL